MGKAERERKKRAAKAHKYTLPPNRDQDRVKIFDIRNGSLGTIMGRELAAGMVPIGIEGMGSGWIDVRHLRQGVFQHPPFSEATRDQVRTIQQSFADIYPESLEQWEAGFRRDGHPQSEIALWLYLADVYGRLTQQKSPAEKRDIFAVLLVCANSTPRQHVLTTAGLTALSQADGEAVMAEFYQHAPEGAIKEIKVTMTRAQGDDTDVPP